MFVIRGPTQRRTTLKRPMFVPRSYSEPIDPAKPPFNFALFLDVFRLQLRREARGADVERLPSAREHCGAGLGEFGFACLRRLGLEFSVPADCALSQSSFFRPLHGSGFV